MEFNEFFESCVDGIIKISKDQILLNANKSFSDLIGYNCQEVIGKSFADFTPSEYRNHDIEYFENLSNNGFIDEYLKDLIRKNGIVITVSVRLWAVFTNGEISNHFWGIVKEVSTQKGTSEKIDLAPKIENLLSNEFNLIFDYLPIGLAYINSDKQFKIINKTYVSLLELNRDDIINKSCDEFFNTNRKIIRQIWLDPFSQKCYYDEVRTTKKMLSFFWECDKKHFRIRYFPVLGEEQEGFAVLMIIDDYTEVFALEKKFRQVQKMDSIGSLTGGIAHDFNNILTGILGYAELLKINLPKEVQSSEEIQGIVNAGNRARDLIKQLLTFSRQTESKSVVVNITTIMKEIIRLLRGSLPSNIEIYTEYPIDSWNTLADPAQIHQVIMNLCINAQQAMLNGGILRLMVQNVDIDEEFSKRNMECVPGKYVCLIVEDSGSGMDEEVKNRVFEPFFTTKTEKGGTGLGLSIVYGIIKGMQGFIELESEINVGTTFKIYFPAVFKEIAVESSEDESTQGGNEVILFVDDEVPIVDITTSILKNFGYKTLKAYNGLEALEMYKRHQNTIDLIITDLTMPKMTGTTLAKEILKINKDAKIILCSGFASHQIVNELKDLGIKEFIPKPLIASVFLNTIRKVVNAS